MKESFYFPHDNNAHNDPKLMTVFMKTWLSWIGLYWILIENMHQQDNWMITEEQYTDYIHWYSSKESRWTAIVQQLLNIYLTSGLFCKNDEWMIYSKRVIDNKLYRENLSEKRSEAWKKSALARQQSTSVQQNSTIAQQGKERKLKEKKEKETDNSVILSEKIQTLEKWSVRYDFYSYLLTLWNNLEQELSQDTISSIDLKLEKYYKEMWKQFISEMESFIIWHTEKKSKFSNVLLRLNSWFNKKITK